MPFRVMANAKEHGRAVTKNNVIIEVFLVNIKLHYRVVGGLIGSIL